MALPLLLLLKPLLLLLPLSLLRMHACPHTVHLLPLLPQGFPSLVRLHPPWLLPPPLVRRRMLLPLCPMRRPRLLLLPLALPWHLVLPPCSPLWSLTLRTPVPHRPLQVALHLPHL